MAHPDPSVTLHRPTRKGNLTFALKYEGLDLAYSKRLFAASGPGRDRGPRAGEADRELIARRIWFTSMSD